MKTTIKRPVEIEVAFVRMELPVRYGEEDIPNDFPLREGDMWRATVCIDNGEIQEWPKGKAGELHMKVCDSGVYILLNHCGEELDRREDYVPNGLIPGEYGDYVELEINEQGVITNWPKRPRLTGFFGGEEDC